MYDRIASFTQFLKFDDDTMELRLFCSISTPHIDEARKQDISCFDSFSKFQLVHQNTDYFIISVRHKNQQFCQCRFEVLKKYYEAPKLVERSWLVHK